MTELHPVIAAELQALRETLTADGTILPEQKLKSFHDTFRRAFGPDVLRSLNGVALLDRMHAHGNQDSLVYWLEFKDDDEFPGSFGSILGGSALKFGVYRRKETGTWARKGSGPVPVDITVEEAVAIAESHRDQILRAVEVLTAFSANAGAGDDHYRQLQTDLTRVAPDVEDSAWGHKYFALLFPDLLDSFHAGNHEHWNLVRLLQLPPLNGDEPAKGRYVCAGRFVEIARYLALSLPATATLLNRRHGPPKNYWRVGTTDDERARRKFWPMMRDGGVVAIGWPALGDLSAITAAGDQKDALADLLRQHYPATVPTTVGRSASQIQQFLSRMMPGDRILAADGQTILGVGEVAGPYAFDPSTALPHQRPVTWRSQSEWPLAVTEALRMTVGAVRKYRNQVEVERRILEDAGTVKRNPTPPRRTPPPPTDPSPERTAKAIPRLTDVASIVQSVLERKGQALLYGPPGTGKTYWALRTARDMAALRTFGAAFDTLSDAQRARVVDGTQGEPALVRVTSFHPEYGYEDFIEGYRPKASIDGYLAFSLVPGVFRRLCADAAARPRDDFFLVIDEINRGDVPRIFGELLTLLERDKRGQAMTLPASGESFRVPINVHVIGTMNTADRSIALLDVALRRRFGFVELMPDYRLLRGAVIAGLPLGSWLEELNARVRRLGGGDARNRQIGHAFLLSGRAPITTAEQFSAIMRDDIVPLLEEYCYDDFSRLSDVLGPNLVHAAEERVRRELFEAGAELTLINALQRPEIVTAAAAIAASSIDESSDTEDETSERDAEDDDTPLTAETA